MKELEQLTPNLPDGCGLLPAAAPLANPYVPFQQKDPDLYPAGKAMIRGTLFPGLDLPFLGMANKTEKPRTPLHELQAMNFVLQELALYLDTHARDEEAEQLFAEYSALYRQGVEKYEQRFGPLFQTGAIQNGVYRWTQGPWPWEYQSGTEG